MLLTQLHFIYTSIANYHPFTTSNKYSYLRNCLKIIKKKKKKKRTKINFQKRKTFKDLIDVSESICFSSGMVQSVGANLSPDQTFGSIRSLSVTREVASFPLSRTPTPPPQHRWVMFHLAR